MGLFEKRGHVCLLGQLQRTSRPLSLQFLRCRAIRPQPIHSVARYYNSKTQFKILYIAWLGQPALTFAAHPRPRNLIVILVPDPTPIPNPPLALTLQITRTCGRPCALQIRPIASITTQLRRADARSPPRYGVSGATASNSTQPQTTLGGYY